MRHRQSVWLPQCFWLLIVPWVNVYYLSFYRLENQLTVPRMKASPGRVYNCHNLKLFQTIRSVSMLTINHIALFGKHLFAVYVSEEIGKDVFSLASKKLAVCHLVGNVCFHQYFWKKNLQFWQSFVVESPCSPRHFLWHPSLPPVPSPPQLPGQWSVLKHLM